MSAETRPTPMSVVLVVAMGLIAILLSIVWGLFLNERSLPNWAENVLVSIATASALKLGDAMASVVALVTGRQLAQSQPAELTAAPAPDDAADAAQKTADAAQKTADAIAGDAR